MQQNRNIYKLSNYEKIMAPILDIADKDFERAKSLLKLSNVDYSVLNSKDSDNFIDFPYTSKEKNYFEKDWFEAQKALKTQGSNMLTIPEFVEALKDAKENYPNIYKNIIAVRNPWRAEWLDAHFEKRGNGLYILTKNRTIAEPLNSDTLMEDKRIDLESWLENPTSQGLPRKNVKDGNLYYWHPRNESVSKFYGGSVGADFGCDWDPYVGGSGSLGARRCE